MSFRAPAWRLRPGARRHRQRGMAVVEFAIGLPLLLFLMLAAAEFGRIMVQYETLTKSVRDACRYVATGAAVGTTDVVSITTQVRADAGNLVAYGNVAGTGSPLLPGLSPAAVTVSAPGNGYVSVAATYTYTPVIGPALPSFGFGNPNPLTLAMNAAVVMRAL